MQVAESRGGSKEAHRGNPAQQARAGAVRRPRVILRLIMARRIGSDTIAGRRLPGPARHAEFAMPKKRGCRPLSRRTTISMGGLIAAIAAIAVGGCDRTSRPSGQVVAASPRAPAPPVWPPLPDNAACAKDLARYQTVLDADVGSGNLNRSVYDEIETDLSRAAEACASGHDGEARAIVRSTKLKHGYRASL